jgi:hypothetical protein
MQSQRNRERVSELALLHRHLFSGLADLACTSLAASPLEPHPVAAARAPVHRVRVKEGPSLPRHLRHSSRALSYHSQSPGIRGCSTLTTGPPWDDQNITNPRHDDDIDYIG